MARISARLVAPLAAGTLLLAACGGDDDSVTIDPTTTTEATTTTVGDPPLDGVVLADSPDGTTTPPGPVGEPSTADQASPDFPGSGEPALMTDVAVSQYDDLDRIVFTFEADAPLPEYEIEWVTPPIMEMPSGREVTVLGETHALLTLSSAAGVDLSGDEARVTFDGPARIRAPEDGGITEIAQTSDFESTVQWAIGMSTASPIGVAVLSGDGDGARVVVDVLRTAGTDGELALASYDQGVRDFSVVTYPGEGGRCYELRLPTDATPSRSAVECDASTPPLDVHVLREGDVQALVGVVPPGSAVVDVDLVANDGSLIVDDDRPLQLVDLGGGASAFVPVQDPAFISAIVGYDDAGDEVVRVDL